MPNNGCPMGGSHAWEKIPGYGPYPDRKVCTKCGKSVALPRGKRDKDYGGTGAMKRGRAWKGKK